MTAWLHTLHVVCNHVSFHVLYACSPSPYRNYWASGLQSCREVGLSSDHTPVRSDIAPLTTLHYVCLGVCSLAVITPSVLHTVSGWYPSGAWLTAAADFLVYSPVTSRPRDAWPCDKLTCSRASFVSYITEADHNAYANLYPRTNTKSWRILPTQGRAKLHKAMFGHSWLYLGTCVNFATIYDFAATLRLLNYFTGWTTLWSCSVVYIVRRPPGCCSCSQVTFKGCKK